MDGWRSRAACRGLDPEMFLLDKTESADVPKAKAVCASCTVRDDCLEEALAPVYVVENRVKTVGIWGGTSEKQRRELVR